MSKDLSATGIKAFLKISRLWHLTIIDQCAIMCITIDELRRFNVDPDDVILTEDQLNRASYVLGIYSALHIIFNDDFADEWIWRPNAGELFKDQPPVDLMCSRNIDDLKKIRNMLDVVCDGVYY
jgi:hypothetical protein